MIPIPIEIVVCPNHPESHAVILNGARVLGDLCCGRWRVIAQWLIREAELDGIKKRLRGPKLRRAPKALPPKGGMP